MSDPVTLGELAKANPKVREILENESIANTQAAKQITERYGFVTSERSVRRYRTAHRRLDLVAPPKGWEPYAEEAGKIGSAIVRLPRPGATERDLLTQSGFDPDSWRIKGAINTRRWMRYDQEWLYYYKFDVEQGESVESAKAHIDELVKLIRRRKWKQRHQGMEHLLEPASSTYVIVLSDWQIGKAEQGKGSADTIQRWKDCLAQAVEDIVRLRRSGVEIEDLAILSVGDLVEGCGDHYDMQTFLVDLDRRAQNRVVRELLHLTLTTLVPMFVHTTVACIGGNHGENRRKGKAFTTFADNDDVATIEAVREAFDLAGWDHIDWAIPDEELSVNVTLSGVNIGLVHGHQFKGGANTWKKAEDWWRGNDFGLQAVEKSQILLSGHFHFNAEANVSGNRSWFQAPTIDPGSKWYTDISGNSSVPGVLTFVASSEYPLGYDYRRILHPHDLSQVN